MKPVRPVAGSLAWDVDVLPWLALTLEVNDRRLAPDLPPCAVTVDVLGDGVTCCSAAVDAALAGAIEVAPLAASVVQLAAAVCKEPMVVKLMASNLPRKGGPQQTG